MTNGYLHRLDGRLRIKIAGVRGLPERAAILERQFAGLTGLHTVSANPTTGNVLICYDPERLRERDVLQALRRLGWHRPANPARPSSFHVHGDGTAHRVMDKMVTAVLEICLLRLLHFV